MEFPAFRGNVKGTSGGTDDGTGTIEFSLNDFLWIQWI